MIALKIFLSVFKTIQFFTTIHSATVLDRSGSGSDFCHDASVVTLCCAYKALWRPARKINAAKLPMRNYRKFYFAFFSINIHN